jgi:hypothetical protein
VNGAINILVALGFRETQIGNLQLPLDADLSELEGRRLEIQVGVENCKKRLQELSAPKAEESGKDKKSAALKGKASTITKVEAAKQSSRRYV